MHVDATCERTRDAGSTPATSTISLSVYGGCGAIAQLLPDYCPHLDGRFEYPTGSGIHISKKQNRCLNSGYGFSYLVEVPGRLTGRGRVRRQFKSVDQAAGFALLTVEGQKKLRPRIAPMSQYRKCSTQSLGVLSNKNSITYLRKYICVKLRIRYRFVILGFHSIATRTFCSIHKV